MSRWIRIVFLIGALHLLLVTVVGAQPAGPSYAEAGRFLVSTFSPADYEASPANWAAAQDAQGLLYVANTGGVLVHDGATWRTIRLPNSSSTRSLAVDSTGRVFVGGYDEFGYLIEGASGIAYRSLVDSLPPDARSFADVWTTLATPGGVYFITPHRLFRWSDAGGLEHWSSEAPMQWAARLRDTVFVHRAGRGLAAVREGALQHVSGTEPLAGTEVHFMAPLDDERLLVGTRAAGLFAFDGVRLTRFPTEVDDRIEALLLSDGHVLPDGSIALATLQGGILWLEADGRLLRTFGKDAELPSNDVKALFYDDQDGLWAMTGNGLARIPLPAPLTAFTEADGFSGSVYTAVRHSGRLHIGTSQGVFVMRSSEAAGRPPRFAPIRNLGDACQALLPVGTELLAGCSGGIYRIEQGGAERIAHPDITYVLYRSPSDTSRVLAGLNSGLVVLRRQDEGWRPVRTINAVRAQIRMIVEDARGNVWLGTNHDSTYRLRLDEADRVMRLDYFDRWEGQRVHVFEADGAPLFSIRYGLFRYDPSAGPADPFVPDTVLGATLTGAHQNIFRLSERSNGDLLLRSGSESGFAYRQDDGTYRWTSTALRRLPAENVYAFFAEDDSVAWVGGAEGLFRHDARVAAPYARDVPVLVREARLINRDTTLYAGAGTAVLLPRAIDHGDNSVRFAYAAPRFEAPEAVRYRVRLVGFDADWSAWTTETRKDYTNLSEGRYTFEVQARDVYGHLNRTATMAFTVQPPWYRAWWAYGLYALLGLGLFAGAVRRRSARLRARAQQLEAEVKARTTEVARQKKQLEEQNTRLEEQATRLSKLDEAKSRFFANLSHEFRTPITLILGPIEDLLARASEDDEGTETLHLVHRNANRLLRLINQLLDLAKLEAGHMRLEAARTDATAFLRSITRAFLPLAERRGIDLAFVAPEIREETLLLYADRDKLEKIMANLLSNAFKATPSGGRIDVRLRRDDEHAAIVVKDTGRGISSGELETIFDRFQQHDAASIEPGTGIGLNLVKEFVELHGGTVMVDSTPGEGARFTVCLPLGRDHLRDEDIVEAPPVARGEEAASDGVPSSPEASAEESDEPPAASDEDVPAILIVDDNPDIRAYVRAQMEAHYRVAEAADGVEGLARAEAVLPDCIIADVMMPRMDGYAFSAALKAHPDLDHIPLILLTAKAESAHRIEGLETGADDYLTKPFNAQELITRVGNLITSRHRLREKFSQAVVLAPSEVDVEAADAVFLHQVRDIVETHMTDPDFSTEQLADAVALSASQLQRKVKALTDQTPVQLIRAMRLERAAQLLDQDAGTITEIAYAVGFNSYAHFARSFKQHFGQSASEYRKR